MNIHACYVAFANGVILGPGCVRVGGHLLPPPSCLVELGYTVVFTREGPVARNFPNYFKRKLSGNEVIITTSYSTSSLGAE
jgi:hypothetical protein